MLDKDIIDTMISFANRRKKYRRTKICDLGKSIKAVKLDYDKKGGNKYDHC